MAPRSGTRRGLPKDALGRARERLEQARARVRAKVEHLFQVIKR
ncbi:MAG: hypothetical protein P8Z69_04655 [Acidihalobacter sp.]